MVSAETVDFTPKTNGGFIILAPATAVVAGAEFCSLTFDAFTVKGKVSANEEVVATTGSVATAAAVMEAVSEETATGSVAFNGDDGVTDDTTTEDAIGDMGTEEDVMSG